MCRLTSYHGSCCSCIGLIDSLFTLLEIECSGVAYTRSNGHGKLEHGSLVEHLPSMLEALDSCLATYKYKCDTVFLSSHEAWAQCPALQVNKVPCVHVILPFLFFSQRIKFNVEPPCGVGLSLENDHSYWSSGASVWMGTSTEGAGRPHPF